MNKNPEIMQMIEEIKYCKRMIDFSECIYSKLYFINLACFKIEQAATKFENLVAVNNNLDRQPEKQFTLEELAKYDGSMGKPAYVAVNGIVYDVSWNKSWSGGTHFGVYAGKDLSEEFKKNHSSNIEILKELPVVGVLK
jgi:predicted heme/steroid binding protein